MLHFQSVHFPIALLLVGALFEVIGYFSSQPFPRQASLLFLVLGWIGAGVAVGSGLWLGSEHVDSLLQTHKTLGLVTLGLSSGALLMHLLHKRWKPLAYVRSVFYGSAAILVACTAHFGGLMVHGQGPKDKPTAREKAESSEGLIRIQPPRLRPQRTTPRKQPTRTQPRP